MGSKVGVAVLILTLDEEKHISRAIRSVQPFASEIFVIDSISSDGTVELARSMGATVLQNKFVNYARQFQWALDHAPITADWVMRLDADEVVESDLAQEIAERIPTLGLDVAGVNLKLKEMFLGRWIRHGGRYPFLMLRIWRRGQGRIEDRWMDEHMVVWGGRIVTFDGNFSNHNLNDLTFFTEKHNKYATREAVDVLNRKYKLFSEDNGLSLRTASRHATIKRWLKEKVYNRLPFWIGPLLYVLWRCGPQLGFLDGREGLIYHVLQGFWYRFLVGAKVLEFERAIAPLPSREERLRALARLTGLRL